ncbi:hypothetical protein Tco_1338313 [Tanacetum coccineum]
MNALIFHKMDTEEISDRYVVPCFVSGLEVKRGHKVVKKELIIALRGDIYFVMLIINPKEDDVEPGVVLGRSFMRLTNGIADFGNGTVTIYPELNPFLDSSREEEKIGDDWDLLLDDLDFGDIPNIEGVEVPPFVCKMGKNSRNKRKHGKINLNALVDTHSDINVMPYHVYKELGREEHSEHNRKDHIYLDGICHQTFRAAKKSLDTTESDSYDEEEYVIQRNKFGAPIYGPKPA